MTLFNCNGNCRVIIFMLFFTFWCKPLKTDPSREMCTYATWATPFCQMHLNAYPDKLVFCLLLFNLQCLALIRVSIGKTRLILISYFSCPKANFDLEWYAREYIDYILKLMLVLPNLTANAWVVFNLCSYLITTITLVNYHSNLSCIKSLMHIWRYFTIYWSKTNNISPCSNEKLNI